MCSPDQHRVTAAIGIGSNLGDRSESIAFAHRRLAALGDLRCAETVETPPIGPPGQGPYLNTAALLETSLGPRELLDALLAIERAAGRERANEQRWGPRTLDLDLLLHGDTVLDEPGLHLPHPRMHERFFVLEPLATLAPTLLHPQLNRTVAQLLDDLRVNPPHEHDRATM